VAGFDCRQAPARCPCRRKWQWLAIADHDGIVTTRPSPDLRVQALQALLETDPQQKVLLALSPHAHAATLSIASQGQIKIPAGVPGCAARPELRSHLNVPRRSPFTASDLAALIHAVTHIEFNAIKNASHSTAFHSVMHLADNCFRPEAVFGQCEY
jgi:hypothetical protein